MPSWIALDKGLCHYVPDDRPLSIIEAMFCYSLDIDNGKEGTIQGYAKQWGWSRKKVRKFVSELGTQRGHIGNTKGTQRGHPVFFIDVGLRGEGDTKGTHRGHKGDTKGYTTKEPKPNPEPKPKENTRPPANSFDPLKAKPGWIESKDWTDLIEHRKRSKAQNSERAIAGLVAQIEKAKLAGWTPKECVDEIVNRGWRGFKAEWMESRNGKSRGNSQGLGFAEPGKAGKTDWLS